VPCPSALDAARRALDNDPEINDDEIVLDMEDEDDPGLLADLKAMHCVDGDPNPVAQAGVRVGFSLSVFRAQWTFFGA